MPISDPWFYVVAVPAVLLSGISKGGFGGGLGILAVPLMALFVSPFHAAAIMLPILCTMDLFGLWAYRNTWDRRNLIIMLPAALVGIAVGALTFRFFDEDFVRLLVGGIAVAFTLNRWLKRQPKGGRGAGIVSGSAWSVVAGFTSFVAHAGGPPLQFHLLPQRLDKTVYVGTTVVFFLVVNYVKLVPYGILGLFSPANLGTALVLAPLAPLGIRLGVRLHSVVPEVWFYRVCYVMLLLTGCKLIWDGLSP